MHFLILHARVCSFGHAFPSFAAPSPYLTNTFLFPSSVHCSRASVTNSWLWGFRTFSLRPFSRYRRNWNGRFLNSFTARTFIRNHCHRLLAVVVRAACFVVNIRPTTRPIASLSSACAFPEETSRAAKTTTKRRQQWKEVFILP